MNQKQKQYALDGLQERIDKISANYAREVVWNHLEEKFQREGISSKEVKSLKNE